jgi:SAM-dependent methyltransferase
VERYVLRGGRWGYDRLQLLARVRRAHTLELLGLAGLRPGMRCVDLGCGGGEGTFELAELAGPGGFVVGVDMDEVKLALARAAAAERGLANVEFRQVNVNDWAEPAGPRPARASWPRRFRGRGHGRSGRRPRRRRLGLAPRRARRARRPAGRPRQ